tara:strand:- start:1010 stop:3127 length:2118 start_codon:yes stop_codon:yes gene_type:complete
MKQFQQQLQARFLLMCSTGQLFRSEISGRMVWDIYLKSFDEDTNPIFRDPNSSSKNCNHCNNFIRRYGNIVAIDEKGHIMTIFDVNIEGEYEMASKQISHALRSSGIANVFFETFKELQSLPYESCKANQAVFRLGTDKNPKRYTQAEADLYGVVKKNELRIFEHMYLDIPSEYVDTSNNSIDSIMAIHKSNKDVFKRGMEEIPSDTLLLVYDLINQGSLLNGDAHLHKVSNFLSLKGDYDALPESVKDNWCWKTSRGLAQAKFKNELIGVLCSELAEGEDLNKACQSWNKRVDPANYMKATAPITKQQIEQAQSFVEEGGYTKSFARRTAKLDDIKASEIMHINSGDGEIEGVSMFDGIKANKTRHKRNEFEGIEEVTIENFMAKILPGCTSVQAYVANSHENNMVTMTTPMEAQSKPLFKWNNNYSWTYNGNLTGKSQIKESVKSQGGKVDGVLRFSIMWAEDDFDKSDLDAHCNEPNGNTIYFNNPRSNTGGNLDIDIQSPQSHKQYTGKDVVENITFPTLSKMPNGDYKFMVHQFSRNQSQGFKAEIEFDGQIFYYEYNKSVTGRVQVAVVSLKNNVFSIDHKLPETHSNKEVYGLETNQFHQVELACLSPNHWNDNKIGNKHYFFMLKGCKAQSKIRSFHIENLLPELAEHRKVLEVLGNTTMITPEDKELSGIGFNATVRDELIVKLTGTHKRMVKIKF